MRCVSIYLAAACFIPALTYANPSGFALAPGFGHGMVLQRAPAKAAIYGTVDAGTSHVLVKVVGEGLSYQVEAVVTGGKWKAFLKPAAAGGNWSITGLAGGNIVSLQRVTFGDVWYCGGQSNMALPIEYTMSRNKSVDMINAGRYSNIRIHGLAGNMNPFQPWIEMKDSVSGCDHGNSCPFFKYSSTCWYFGESLTDELGSAAPPIGLIHTAFGGSTIEQWLDNETMNSCRNATRDQSNQEWHDKRVLPYTDMTLKGWIWYQGENDMHGVHGNSNLGYGYGCLMPALVSAWRKLWSAVEGTTDEMAPFGFVTLASSGTEGGNSVGAMRWAQTANFGVAPNPAMPNTFLAQAFDLDDPFGNITCYRVGCCPNNYHPTGSCHGCEAYCASTMATNYYMGPIHPRVKKPVGQRLARAGAAIAYHKQGVFTGPTLSSCSVSHGKVTLNFNADLLGSDRVVVQKYVTSKMQVLTNRSLFCLQTAGRGSVEECIDDGAGQNAGRGPFDDVPRTWIDVDITASSATSVAVDLSKSGGVAHAIRYAWDGSCCDGRAPTSDPCPIASCPLMAEAAGLPANPFLAKIVDGKCECISPQSCEKSTPTPFIV